MTFIKRDIDVQFQFATGPDATDLGDTVSVSGLRTSVEAQKILDVNFQGVLSLEIGGLPLSLINQLTTIGVNAQQKRNNIVRVFAGDAVAGMSLFYTGQIYTAYGDFNATPDVTFNVIATAAQTAAVTVTAAKSYKGSIGAEVVLQQLAQQGGFTFVNNGVSVPLSNPYFPGSLLDQMRACALAANVNMVIENNIVTIFPRLSGNDKGITIGPDTGLIGYPTFSSQGIAFTCMFDSRLTPGDIITLQSSLPVACGKWRIFSVYNRLQSLTPGGPWFSIVEASPYVQ